MERITMSMYRVMGVGMWVACCVLSSCIEVDEKQSRVEAARYATQLGYEVLGTACSGMDQDADGYVFCSVRVKEIQAPLALECQWVGGKGCKQALPKLRGSN